MKVQPSRDLKRRRQLAKRAALRGTPLKLDGTAAALAQEQVVVRKILGLMGQRDGTIYALAVLRGQYPAQYLACEKAVAREPVPAPAELLVRGVADAE